MGEARRRTGLRVLHVARPLQGGVPRYVGDVSRDQVDRGWNVAVACPPDSDTRPAVLEAGARFISWSATRSPGPSIVDETRRLSRILVAEDPDVVHLHAAKAGVAGRLAVRGTRPTIFQPHAWSFEEPGFTSRLASMWEQAAARWAHLVICVSEDERRRGCAAGVRSHRLEIVNNGVDLGRFPPCFGPARRAARRALGIDPDAPLAVTIGRLDTQKNQHGLLDAWPGVRSVIPSARLALVGDGPHRESLAAREVNGVSIVGHTDDVGSWLAAASLVVAPSRWEGLSLSVLEAQASARSVVVSDVAGMRDAVGSAAGAIVPAGDKAALAEAIVRRLADSDLADREGEAGRRRVEQRFDLRFTTGRVAELYEVLTDAR